jgi:hypothetical protein
MSTLDKSLHAKSPQSAFISRFLVTDLNNEDSPASVLTSLLSGEYPATDSELTSARVRVTLRLTVSQSVSQSVCLSWCRAPSGAHDQIFILIGSYSPVHTGRPL